MIKWVLNWFSFFENQLWKTIGNLSNFVWQIKTKQNEINKYVCFICFKNKTFINSFVNFNRLFFCWRKEKKLDEDRLQFGKLRLKTSNGMQLLQWNFAMKID